MTKEARLAKKQNKVGDKIKENLTSDRTWALIAFIGATLANSVLHLNLQATPPEGGVPPLALIALNVGAFIIGKSLRKTQLGDVIGDISTLDEVHVKTAKTTDAP